MNVKRAGFDPNLLRQHVGFGLSWSAAFNFRPHEDLIAIPTFDGHAAVLSSVNGYGAARGQRLFLDLAMAIQPIIVAGWAAFH